MSHLYILQHACTGFHRVLWSPSKRPSVSAALYVSYTSLSHCPPDTHGIISRSGSAFHPSPLAPQQLCLRRWMGSWRAKGDPLLRQTHSCQVLHHSLSYVNCGEYFLEHIFLLLSISYFWDFENTNEPVLSPQPERTCIGVSLLSQITKHWSSGSFLMKPWNYDKIRIRTVAVDESYSPVQTQPWIVTRPCRRASCSVCVNKNNQYYN